MPLVARLSRAQAERRRNWFRELLPEGSQRDYLLQQGGLRPGDTLGFLARYGRDVAGAVQLWDVDDPTEPKTPAVTPVSADEIKVMLKNPLAAPLGNAPAVGKTSLQGVQPKIVLAHMGSGAWGQVAGGFPSSRIIKPLTQDIPQLIYDEEYGSRVMRKAGWAQFETWIENFAGAEALVIQRYDRRGLERIHQEDFSQALGASGNQKYQEIGGVVRLARIAEVLEQNGRHRDVHVLGRGLVAAVALGNLDMHTKNLSLLHPQEAEIQLAPAYDFVPQAQYPRADGRLALAVNKKYVHAAVTRQDMEAELSSWGLRRASQVVGEALETLRNVVDSEDPHPSASVDLAEGIRHRISDLLSE